MSRVVPRVVSLALAVALGGCTAAPTEITAPTSATPTPSSPGLVAQCTAQLTYWAGESLRDAPDVGYDYQEMGLTDAKYQELRALLRAAEVELATGPLPASWVDERAAAACRRIAALPTPTVSRGGWP